MQGKTLIWPLLRCLLSLSFPNQQDCTECRGRQKGLLRGLAMDNKAKQGDPGARQGREQALQGSLGFITKGASYFLVLAST
jgi:hypothetical protein